MSVCFIPPYSPLLYSKTGVYKGITLFSYFCSKTYIVGTRENRLNEAVRTCTHNILSKNMKIVKKVPLKIVLFTAVKRRCILHGHVFVMY